MAKFHVEFPPLTPEAQAAHDAVVNAIRNGGATISPNDFRRALAAFLREAMKQADPLALAGSCCRRWGKLGAIATFLHNPPPPPTLAEAREADLDTPAGKATVRAFLASLGEGVQP